MNNSTAQKKSPLVNSSRRDLRTRWKPYYRKALLQRDKWAGCRTDGLIWSKDGQNQSKTRNADLYRSIVYQAARRGSRCTARDLTVLTDLKNRTLGFTELNRGRFWTVPGWFRLLELPKRNAGYLSFLTGLLHAFRMGAVGIQLGYAEAQALYDCSRATWWKWTREMELLGLCRVTQVWVEAPKESKRPRQHGKLLFQLGPKFWQCCGYGLLEAAANMDSETFARRLAGSARRRATNATRQRLTLIWSRDQEVRGRGPGLVQAPMPTHDVRHSAAQEKHNDALSEHAHVSRTSEQALLHRGERAHSSENAPQEPNGAKCAKSRATFFNWGLISKPHPVQRGGLMDPGPKGPASASEPNRAPCTPRGQAPRENESPAALDSTKKKPRSKLKTTKSHSSPVMNWSASPDTNSNLHSFDTISNDNRSERQIDQRQCVISMRSNTVSSAPPSGEVRRRNSSIGCRNSDKHRYSGDKQQNFEKQGDRETSNDSISWSRFESNRHIDADSSHHKPKPNCESPKKSARLGNECWRCGGRGKAVDSLLNCFVCGGRGYDPTIPGPSQTAFDFT